MNEKKQIKVPQHLVNAAKELQRFGFGVKMPQYQYLPKELQEVIMHLTDGSKVESEYLMCLVDIGDFRGGCQCSPHRNETTVYRIDPDVEIVAIEEQTWWQKAGFILCKVKRDRAFSTYHIHLPNGEHQALTLLPAVPCHIEGYDFVGWAFDGLFNQANDIHNTPLLYYSSHKKVFKSLQRNSVPITASWTVWKKSEVQDGK